MTDSSRDAQAEIRKATAKSETAYAGKREITGTNLTGDTFDATAVSACRAECCGRAKMIKSPQIANA